MWSQGLLCLRILAYSSTTHHWSIRARQPIFTQIRHWFLKFGQLSLSRLISDLWKNYDEPTSKSVTNWSAHIFVKAWRLLMKLYGDFRWLRYGVALEPASIFHIFETSLPREV